MRGCEHELLDAPQVDLVAHGSSRQSRFKRLCKNADVPVLTPHGLRHTYATLLVEAGVPDRVIADQLGHRDTRFTASVYVHPPQATRAAILARAEGWEARS